MGVRREYPRQYRCRGPYQDSRHQQAARFAVTHSRLQFTDTTKYDPASTPVSWSWDFGDGGTSPLQNPVHTFVAPPPTDSIIYNVTLTVTAGSCVNKITRPITLGRTTASFITPNTTCREQVVFMKSNPLFPSLVATLFLVGGRGAFYAAGPFSQNNFSHCLS